MLVGPCSLVALLQPCLPRVSTFPVLGPELQCLFLVRVHHLREEAFRALAGIGPINVPCWASELALVCITSLLHLSRLSSPSVPTSLVHLAVEVLFQNPSHSAGRAQGVWDGSVTSLPSLPTLSFICMI